MKSSPGSYLLSLASAVAGAIVGALLVAIPLILRHSQHTSEWIHYCLKWVIPFVAGFALFYGVADWLVRKKYLAIRRWTKWVSQSLL